MKKILALVLSAITALSVCGCSNNDGGDETDTESGANDTKINISANDLLGGMRESAVTFPQYEISSSHDDSGKANDGWEDIFSVSLFDEADAGRVESFAIAYSTEATADEITVVVLKDASYAEQMKKEMKKRVKSRISMFETYGPDEVIKLESAKIVSKGNVVALIVCDNPEDVAMAFKNQTKT